LIEEQKVYRLSSAEQVGLWGKFCLVFPPYSQAVPAGENQGSLDAWAAAKSLFFTGRRLGLEKRPQAEMLATP
jgi:hypothetical protein